MNGTRLSRHSGFTLLELLVVLVVVSIIGMGSYALLETFFSTDRVLDSRAEEMRRLSMAMYRMDDDLRQLSARPVKNAYSGYEPALLGQPGELEFTRLGAANLGNEPRGDLQRLHYGIGYLEESAKSAQRDDDDESALLLRSRWRVLDRGPDSESISEPLLAGIESMEFRYYDPESQAWLAQWPPPSSQQSLTQADTRMPQAIEMILQTRTGGELRRVFNIPVGSQPQGASSSSGGSGASSSSGGRGKRND